MARIGIEQISVFGLPPVAFVNLAADLGCQHISTGLASFDFGVHDYPTFSLREDTALRRDMIMTMRDRGVSISLGEGIMVREGGDVRNLEGDLDLFCELGADRINAVSMDPDLQRTFDQIAVVAEMGGARGLEVTTEFAPVLTINNLETALAAVRHVNQPHCKLLIDTMHLVRSGSGPGDIAALDPDLIGYVQICDARAEPEIPSYFEESMYERMVPGEGGLGLEAIVAALPHDRVFAIEVPLRSAAKAGAGPHERLGKCVEAVRRLIAETKAAAG